MTIVGTRPELIKMSRVISEFDQKSDLPRSTGADTVAPGDSGEELCARKLV